MWLWAGVGCGPEFENLASRKRLWSGSVWQKQIRTNRKRSPWTTASSTLSVCRGAASLFREKKRSDFFFLFLQLSGLHSSDVCTGVTLDTNHTPNSHFMLLEIKSPVWPVWASSAHMLFQQIEKSDVRPVHVRVCARRRKPMFQCHSLTDPHTMMEGKRWVADFGEGSK